MSIKILYLIDVLDNIGGAEKNLCQIVTNLDGRKFEPVVVGLRLLRYPEKLKNAGIETKVLGLEKLLSLKGLLCILAIYRLIKRERIVLIISYFESSDYFALILHLLTSLPFIINRRDMGYRYTKKQRILNKLVSIFASHIIAVSRNVAMKAKNENNVDEERISVIYNAIDNDYSEEIVSIAQAKMKFNISQENIVVGILGVLRRVKRHDIFIRAANLVIKRFPNTNFLIAGFDAREEGATLEELKSIANELSILSNICFHTIDVDSRNALQAMDICVLTSASEGFSNALLEAMALGKPIVATDVGGNSELVINGYTGILVPVEDINKTSEAIIKMIEKPQMRKQMGEDAIRIVNERYNISKMISQHENLYKKVLK